MKKMKRALSMLLALVLAAMLFPVGAYAAAPGITAPSSISVTEDTETALSGISFSDLDGDTLTVVFSVSNGTLYALSGSGVTTSGNGSTMVILIGSVADINSYIADANLTFLTLPNSTGNVTLSITANDGTDGGTATASVTLLVTAVNDAPVNNVPAAQSVMQDGVLVFSSGNGNALSVSDVDSGGGTVQVTLTATKGLISLSGTAGLVFTVGSGTGDVTMTFEGTISNINAALNGLSFSPTSGYTGPASLKITANDLGLSGSGGNRTDTDTISIAVVLPNPVIFHVIANNADGTYGIGDVINIDVVFDQPVLVGGTPKLLLETGNNDQFAYYSSGSGTNNLTFSYTVQAGDISADLEYKSTNALILDTGVSIASAALGNPAILTLPSVGGADGISGQSDIVIFGMAAPTITGPTGMTLVEGYTAAETLTYTVDGYPVPTVTKTSGNDKITWNNTTKKLEIAAGLLTGSYPVVLTASNGINPNATLSFTLVVNAAPVVPTITGLPSSYTLFTGSQVTWAPQYVGGVWNYDNTFLSMTKNGDQYTFTALKNGTTTVTYSVPGASWSISLIIDEVAVPQTGDAATPVSYLLVGLAVLCTAVAFLRRRKA